MNLLHDLPVGEFPDKINVVVEIPSGSKNKYEYDKKLNMFKLDRVLYSSVFYPGDYGFIPRTHCDDGDPLDVIVLVNTPTYPGILIECRPIAMLEMIDGGEQDNKILAVPVDDPRFDNIKDLKDVSPHVIKEVAEFFRTYKNLQDKEVQIKEWYGVDKAKQEILDSIELYKKHFGKE